MRENLLIINHVVPECQIMNKGNKERINANVDLMKKKILKQIDVQGSLLSSALLVFKKKIPFRNNSVQQNRLEGQN